ncbi:MAG: hypothetical protein JWP94_3882 [Mucilaginibacter sp.]|nr:hypothetical protein [Mucilaginibacter sp.]
MPHAGGKQYALNNYHRLYPAAGLALVISLAATALADGFHVPYVRPVAIIALLTGIGALAPNLPRAGKVFVGTALGLILVTLFTAKEPGAIIYAALSRGTAFAGLMTALGLMREGASNSPLVRACGTHMIAQPPKLRYAALAVGAHLFGLILNLGALVMLSTMIMRGATGTSDERLSELRRRRALTATLRGFATCSTWSPMAITPTVVLSTLPMLKWADIVPYSLALMAMYLVIGGIFDNFETRHLVRALQGTPREPAPVGGWGKQLRLVALVGVILAFVIGAEYLLHANVTAAVMIATPPVGMLWMIIQTRPRRRALLLWLRIKRLVLYRLPRESLETVMFSSSGIIGIMLSALIEPAWIVALTRPIPPQLVPILVFWAVIAAGQIGISPVVSVVVIGGALGAPGVVPVSPYAMAAALTAGWSLTVAWSHFTGSVLTVARIGGVPPPVVSHEWNGRYSMAAALASSLFILGIAFIKAP